MYCQQLEAGAVCRLLLAQIAGRSSMSVYAGSFGKRSSLDSILVRDLRWDTFDRLRHLRSSPEPCAQNRPRGREPSAIAVRALSDLVAAARSWRCGPVISRHEPMRARSGSQYRSQRFPRSHGAPPTRRPGGSQGSQRTPPWLLLTLLPCGARGRRLAKPPPAERGAGYCIARRGCATRVEVLNRDGNPGRDRATPVPGRRAR
jgi:hypothetical protein